MTMHRCRPTCAVCRDYLDRLPERLVVEGFRRWNAGYDTGSIEPWELAWTLYAAELGPAEGRRAVAALASWVRTLRGCSACPLRCFPFDAKRLCREECLALGMIAACQAQDRLTRDVCVAALTAAGRHADVADTAQHFAATLDGIGQSLIPVPAHVIDDIAGRPDRAQFH